MSGVQAHKPRQGSEVRLWLRFRRRSNARFLPIATRAKAAKAAPLYVVGRWGVCGVGELVLLAHGNRSGAPFRGHDSGCGGRLSSSAIPVQKPMAA